VVVTLSKLGLSGDRPCRLDAWVMRAVRQSDPARAARASRSLVALTRPSVKGHTVVAIDGDVVVS